MGRRLSNFFKLRAKKQLGNVVDAHDRTARNKHSVPNDHPAPIEIDFIICQTVLFKENLILITSVTQLQS